MDPEIDRQARAESGHNDRPLASFSTEATVAGEPGTDARYDAVLSEVEELLDAARRAAARSINAVMTATYWEIGRRIVEFEQGGEKRAEYGQVLLQRLAKDLSARFGRGFSYPNVNKFRQFYLAFPRANILSTPSIELRRQKGQTPSGQSPLSKSATLSRKSPAIAQTD